MTKNMTRKGLALGTTIALASALAGFSAPANAAASLVVIPSAGTSTSMISGETYTVKVLGAGPTNLRWEIAGIETASETVAVKTNTNTPTTDVGTTTRTITPDAISSTPGANSLNISVGAAETASVTVRAYVESGDAVGFNAAFDTAYSDAMTVNFIKPADLATTTSIVAPLEGDTTISAKVSFNGINNEQVPQTHVGAYFTKGDASTLYPAAAVTASSQTGTVVTYTAANNYVVGQTVTVAGLTTNAALNLTGAIVTASATNFTIAATTATVASVTESGTASVSAAASVKTNVAWDATDSFKYTTSAVTALVKAGAVKVQPLYALAGSVASTNTVGTAVTATVGTRAAATIVGAGVASTTATAAGATLLNSSFQAQVTVKDGATTPVGVPGAAVTATITSTGLSATAGSEKTLTVNGTTYSSSSLLPGQGSVAKLALVADASGVAKINFTTAGYADTDTISVVFYTENLTSSTLTLTQAVAVYTATVRSFFATTDGSAVAVPVVVYDQFGGVPADKYDVRATFDATNTGYVAQATAAATSASNTFTSLVGGKATLSLLDNGTGLGVNSYDVTIQERLAGNNYGSTIVTAIPVNVHIVSAATLVADTVTVTGTQNATTKVYENAGPVALSLVATADYDAVSVLGTATSAFTTALGSGLALGGTVATVASATVASVVVPGAAVTISGAGLQFSDAANRYAANSITVYANTSGVYSAKVFSNAAGKQTITVTSGAASSTATVVFAQAKDDTATAVTISAPDNVLPGSTLTISAVLTDDFGNTVATDSGATEFNNGTTAPTFSLTSDAPGFQIGTDPTVTGNGGSAKLAYFLGANDFGTFTVTATYDADGTGTASDAITVTKTITIGYPTVSSWTKKLDDSSAKIYAKNIVGAGKVQFFLNGKEIAWVNASSAADSKLRNAAGASYLVRTVEFAAGKNVLEVYVDGVRTTRTAYSK